MKKYLLDTNICIYYLKGLYQLDKKVDEVGRTNCFISEITVAELKFGVENSKTADAMRPIIEAFIPQFAVLPIYEALDVYASEKARLRREGQLIDDFDLLIGATAIVYGLTMVTNNVKHLARLNSVIIEDWTTQPTIN